MPKKVLITGVSGFAGSFLAEHLIALKKYTIYGTYLSDDSIKNISHLKNDLELFKVDLTKKNDVKSLIQNSLPDYVFHLAAFSSPGDSFKKPEEVITNNVVSQIHLLEAIKESNLLNTRILIVSSADVYGSVSPENLPIDEETPFAPENPYAVSKLTQDFLGLSYFLSYGMPIIRVRAFNHIGPRQSPRFVVSAFAKKIAEIEKGTEENVLQVGNLETKRDFTHVKDVVSAYHLVLTEAVPGEVYNIGSGVSYKISYILDMLLSFSSKKITIKKDPSLFRPSDTKDLTCDNSKLIKLTGWKPKISLEETLKETLYYWRNIN